MWLYWGGMYWTPVIFLWATCKPCVFWGDSSLCDSQDLLSHYGSPVGCVTKLGQAMLLFGTLKLEQIVQGQRDRFLFAFVVRSKTPAVSSGEGDGHGGGEPNGGISRILQSLQWILLLLPLARVYMCCSQSRGLPRWLSGKESACQAGDVSLIPELGRSPGEGNGNSLQYSCLENPIDRGWASPWASKRVGHDLATK